MARPIQTNEKFDKKNVIQSYILTTARYNFSVEEKRILYRLIEVAQDSIKGELIKNELCRVDKGLWDVEVHMKYKAILGVVGDGTAEHGDRVRAAAKALSSKVIEMKDTATGEWWCSSIIHSVHGYDKLGYMTFKVDDFLWKALFDFSKGFRKYELITAMKFRSPNTMRLYELLSGQSKPLNFTLEEMKNIVGAGGKYKQTFDFVRRVLEPAKKELDAASPYTFELVKINEGNKITGFRLYPKHNMDVQDPEMEMKAKMAKTPARKMIPQEIYDYLKHSLGFGWDEINRNKGTLVEGYEKIPNFIGFLANLHKGLRTANSPQAYVIGSIQKKIQELAQKEDKKAEKSRTNGSREVGGVAQEVAKKLKGN